MQPRLLPPRPAPLCSNPHLAHTTPPARAHLQLALSKVGVLLADGEAVVGHREAQQVARQEVLQCVEGREASGLGGPSPRQQGVPSPKPGLDFGLSSSRP